MNDYNNNFIFLHIPKTGGSSIKCSINTNSVGECPLQHGHTRMSDRLKHAEKNNIDLDQLFKFTIVRNPWDRAVSCYAYLKTGGNNPSDQKFIEQFTSNFTTFESYVHNLKFMITKPFFPGGLNHMSSMCDWHDSPVDFVCRLEEIDLDWCYICDKINIDTELKKINTSSRASYKEYYTKETRDLIADIYADDIDRYNYKF